MGKRFLLRLSRYNAMKTILSTPAPRWKELLTEFSNESLSSLLVFVFNMTPFIGLDLTTITCIGAVVASYLLMSVSFKTYKYIIRLSVIEDIYRLVLMVSMASLLLVVSVSVIEALGESLYF